MYTWDIIPKTKIIIGGHYKYIGPNTEEDREHIARKIDLSHVIVTDYRTESKTVKFILNNTEKLKIDWLFREEKFKEYFISIKKED